MAFRSRSRNIYYAPYLTEQDERLRWLKPVFMPGLLILGAFQTAGWLPAGQWSFWAMIAAMVLAGVWLLRRRHIRFAACHGRMCTHCGHDLHRLPTSGTCPLCKREFDLQRDIIMWRWSKMSLPDGHVFPPGTALEAEYRAANAQPTPPKPDVPAYYRERTRSHTTAG